ncbi:hypothetical protein NDU88_011593 [Pleurodeles waltl]|uniref:Uncharacterized protein n=1 Tax=Pleurodeles waltl TaxID=8319 RepID=A0AAV7QXR4_PLEWA|nr:hypothetical protein NDU88_011593 [Pleurodeles waltl]
MKRLRAGWIGECHDAVFSSYARGVAILLRKGLQWRTHRVIVDPSGRYVLLGGTLLDRPCRLVSVYGPNVDDPGFFCEARPPTGEVCERTGLLPVREYTGLLPGELVKCRDPAGGRLARRRSGVLGAVGLSQDCCGAARCSFAAPLTRGEERRGIAVR